jgi:hypothetical protein
VLAPKETLEQHRLVELVCLEDFGKDPATEV